MIPAACNKGAGGIRDMCTAVHVCIGGPLAYLIWFLLVPLQARTRHLTVCSRRVVYKEAYLHWFTIKPAVAEAGMLIQVFQKLMPYKLMKQHVFGKKLEALVCKVLECKNGCMLISCRQDCPTSSCKCLLLEELRWQVGTPATKLINSRVHFFGRQVSSGHAVACHSSASYVWPVCALLSPVIALITCLGCFLQTLLLSLVVFVQEAHA